MCCCCAINLNVDQSLDVSSFGHDSNYNDQGLSLAKDQVQRPMEMISVSAKPLDVSHDLDIASSKASNSASANKAGTLPFKKSFFLDCLY